MIKAAVIIMARKNSKRIPEKNYKEFCGIPLIKYTLEVAKRLELPVALFTDFEKIKKMCDAWYPKVMVFDQPAEIQEEHVTCKQQMAWVYSILPAETYILLQPTNPIRDFGYINYCVKDFLSQEYFDSAFSAVLLHERVYNAETGERIKYDKICMDSGNIYIFRNSFLNANDIIFGKVKIYEDKEIINLDTEDDWKRHEILAAGGYYNR